MRRRINVHRKSKTDRYVQRQSVQGLNVQHPVLALQRSIGNSATQRLLRSPYIQTKLETANAAPVSAQSHAVVSGAINQSTGSPLPETSRAFFEPRLGSDFGQVRVHSDSHAAFAARAMNAKAFTVQNSIMFGEGYFSPESHSGKKLLAHELTHVVQQSNTTGSGGSINVAQRDLLDDFSEGVSNAAESAATVAESIGSEVSSGVQSGRAAIVSGVQAVNEAVQGGVDQVVGTVSSTAQAAGQVLDSAGEQVANAVSSVVAPVQPQDAAATGGINWNSPPAMLLKAWALQQNPAPFIAARGNPASLMSQLSFPPDILKAIEELSVQSRSDVGGAAVSPAPVSQPAPVSGPVSTGPVSGVRPISGPSGAPAGGLGVAGGAVFLIFFIIGFILPFLIGWIIEHSEETSQQPDPDEKSLPGGVATQNPSDAGVPSSKPTPKTESQPDRDPEEEKCRETFRNAPHNPNHANPLECDGISMLQVIEQGLEKPKFMLDNPGRYKFGTPKRSQTVEDAEACDGGPGTTFHVPIIDTTTNQPVDVEVSVFECTCCDAEGNLSVVYERPHISGGR